MDIGALQSSSCLFVSCFVCFRLSALFPFLWLGCACNHGFHVIISSSEYDAHDEFWTPVTGYSSHSHELLPQNQCVMCQWSLAPWNFLPRAPRHSSIITGNNSNTQKKNQLDIECFYRWKLLFISDVEFKERLTLGIWIIQAVTAANKNGSKAAPGKINMISRVFSVSPMSGINILKKAILSI